MISLRISENQDPHAREKDNGVLVERFYFTVVFLIEILMEEIELVLAEKEKFEHQFKKITFWNNWIVRNLLYRSKQKSY